LDRRVGAGAEDAVDRQVRALVVERGLEVLDRAAAGAPAELLGGVEDSRRGGDRGRGGEGLRGGGARGRRSGSGGRDGAAWAAPPVNAVPRTTPPSTAAPPRPRAARCACWVGSWARPGRRWVLFWAMMCGSFLPSPTCGRGCAAC